ncbi:hypothetical protein HY970_00150 [Candidatus Kaiserbacteria bacterium]|nr:hypothetical protein [Candidatus Kaiserbacteria bacterium]
MIGIILAAACSIFSEISDSIGKYEVSGKRASAYSFGFLNILFGVIVIVLWGFTYGDFAFSIASLPTLVPRLALEILLAHVSVHAVIEADRSDFVFIRLWTVPLLLIVDSILGYSPSGLQVIGIVLIALTGFLLFSIKHLRIKGFWLVCFTAILAVLTLSLYKYDITHFNSVEAEQSIMYLGIGLYFFCMAFFRARENPFALLRRPIFVVQTLSSGLAVTANAFAYSFAPATIITGALRATNVLAAIISGKLYFRETSFAKKVLLFCIVLLALALLAQPH